MGIKQWWQKVKNEKKRKELIRAAQKLEKQGGSKYTEEDSAQKSCGKIGNHWRGKEEGIGEILFSIEER